LAACSAALACGGDAAWAAATDSVAATRQAVSAVLSEEFSEEFSVEFRP